MKAMDFVMMAFFINAFLFIFTTIGIYNMDTQFQITEDQSGFVDVNDSPSFIGQVLQITGVGALAAGITGIAAYFLAGVTGLQAITLSILLGFFTGVFYNTFGVLTRIAGGLGEFSFVLYIFFGLIGTVFAISMIWGIVQIGMGGARAYE